MKLKAYVSTLWPALSPPGITKSGELPMISIVRVAIVPEEVAPGDIEHKFYKKNVGNVLTIDMAVTPNERSELVQILTGQP